MDHPEHMSINFQDPATAIAEGIIDLHNDIMTFLVPIFIFVCYFLLRVVYLFAERRNSEPVKHVNHHTLLEVICTVIPALILFAIAIPSFALLYAIEETKGAQVTIKCIGNQWY